MPSTRGDRVRSRINCVAGSTSVPGSGRRLPVANPSTSRSSPAEASDGCVPKLLPVRGVYGRLSVLLLISCDFRTVAFPLGSLALLSTSGGDSNSPSVGSGRKLVISPPDLRCAGVPRGTAGGFLILAGYALATPGAFFAAARG